MTAPLLVMSEVAHDTLTAAANAAHPLETGGVMIDVYVDGRPWVTRVVEIASRDRGRRHYQLPAGMTRPAVRAARAEDARLGYLGDWHSHPKDVRPSAVDLASLALVSYRRPRRPNPTLLLARRGETGYTLDARRIVGVHVRPCEIRLAGDLTPASQES
jgi:proteasome lid subunit RPN8/RPN11